MKYRVKVTYIYSDIVEIDAESREQAIDMAPKEAEEKFECLYDCEIISEKE